VEGLLRYENTWFTLRWQSKNPVLTLASKNELRRESLKYEASEALDAPLCPLKSLRDKDVKSKHALTGIE
jgi:hypothetical protein